MKVREILENRSQWMPGQHYGQEKAPKITVVLPTFRRCKNGYLRRAIDSVLKQSFRRLELIIVDDCSTDGSFDLIKNYMKKDPRVSCIRHTSNIGLPAISEYEAFLKARGTYIAYIFDDNEWDSEALAQTYDYMVENQVKACYGYIEVADPNSGSFIELGRVAENHIDTIEFGNFIANGATVLHREVIETVGLYDPHLSLTRVCDYDLWKRISERFEFPATGIFFGREYGPVLSDSLGNAIKLDLWFFSEYARTDRTERLLPQNYGEQDIVGSAIPVSPYFKMCMEQYIEQYRNKAWFDSSKMNTKSLIISKEIKRILVYTPDINASLASFTNYQNHSYVVMYMALNCLLPEYIQYADAVILNRDLLIDPYILKLLKQVSMPVYYFVDDHFIALAKTNANDWYIVEWSKKTSAEFLKQFQGIIVSTKEMAKDFRQRKLHKNIIVLDACLAEHLPAKKSTPNKRLHIAFAGGKHREGILINSIMPALEKLSQTHPIHFFCPEGMYDADILEYASDNLEITLAPRCLSYTRFLNNYRSFHIDIQIHCGKNICNNRYKTINALLTAVSIGATLVASDTEPYCDLPDGLCMLANNNKDSWYEALSVLAEDPKKRMTLYRNAREYCERYHNAAVVWKELDAELQSIAPLSEYEKMKQTEKWILSIRLAGSPFIAGGGSIGGGAAYNPNDLCYSGTLTKKRSYDFICPVEQLREIGLLFVKDEKAQGTVTISVSERGKELFSTQMDVDELRPNAYTNLYLTHTHHNVKHHRMTLSIDPMLTDGSLGIFELHKNRDFVYKVMNKLGHPIKGRNAVYIDCRG